MTAHTCGGAPAPRTAERITVGRYILKRLILVVPTLIGVSLVVFTIMRLLPGDVAREILTGGGSGQGVSQEQVDKLRQQLGLNDPIPVQYAHWISGLVRLDPGTSLQPSHDRIRDLLVERLPVTAELAIGAVLMALLIAIPLGLISAVFQNTWIDYLLRTFSIAGLSIPVFWMGVIVIIVLGRFFHYTPPVEWKNLWVNPNVNFQKIVFPVLIIGYSYAAIVTRLTRSTMVDVLREDFVRTARAKGLRGRQVVLRHALRNALLPIVTIAGLQIGTLLGGAVITESIFALPGLGLLILRSILQRDYPTVQAIVMLAAVVYLLLNLAVDVFYTWLDPRIRFA
jgi:peptide/nickel transport system permease protein